MVTYTPDDLLAAAAREESIYQQKSIPAMLRAGAEAMRECERLRQANDDLWQRMRLRDERILQLERRDGIILIRNVT